MTVHSHRSDLLFTVLVLSCDRFMH